ncbi:MAG: hypothetical protein JWP81_4758 [Ferruginibacter sp.]|nr:hypothetical protein [Ferruginibacter sp.]
MEFYTTRISAKTTAMPTQYFLPIVHPQFELLKRSAGILHFMGASIILVNGLYILNENESAKITCYLQFAIAAEIYLVLLLGRNLLAGSPFLNAFFRITESLTLLGIGVSLISFGQLTPGYMHLLISAGFFFLLYREWRIMHSESINIRQTGITIPNFLMDEEIGWQEIKQIRPKYHAIIIETIRNKKIQFQLRKNLKIEELQQIDEFCRQHLVADSV